MTPMQERRDGRFSLTRDRGKARRSHRQTRLDKRAPSVYKHIHADYMHIT